MLRCFCVFDCYYLVFSLVAVLYGYLVIWFVWLYWLWFICIVLAVDLGWVVLVLFISYLIVLMLLLGYCCCLLVGDFVLVDVALADCVCCLRWVVGLWLAVVGVYRYCRFAVAILDCCLWMYLLIVL